MAGSALARFRWSTTLPVDAVAAGDFSLSESNMGRRRLLPASCCSSISESSRPVAEPAEQCTVCWAD